MTQKWSDFQKKIEEEIQPILFQAGYTLREAVRVEDKDPYEGSDGFVMRYDKEGKPRIVIDVMESLGFETEAIKYFNWLRVYIGAKRLKTLMGLSIENNMHLYDGWIWATNDELDLCIAEIAQGFNTYFSSLTE